MSTNISSTTRHLKFSYISILINLLGTDNKCKNYIQLDQLKKIKRTKSRPKRNVKILQNRSEKIPYVEVKQKNAKS